MTSLFACRCICPEGTSSPYCKHLTVSFAGDTITTTSNSREANSASYSAIPVPNNSAAKFSNSWLWLGGAKLCAPVHISLEFRTAQREGLLLYAGAKPKDKGGGDSIETKGSNLNEEKLNEKNKTNEASESGNHFKVSEVIFFNLELFSLYSSIFFHVQYLFQSFFYTANDCNISVGVLVLLQSPVLSFYLEKGIPRAVFSTGSDTVHLQFADENLNLADEKWHRLDFILTDQVSFFKFK